jgi:hypothetical protein
MSAGKFFVAALLLPTLVTAASAAAVRPAATPVAAPANISLPQPAAEIVSPDSSRLTDENGDLRWWAVTGLIALVVGLLIVLDDDDEASSPGS